MEINYQFHLDQENLKCAIEEYILNSVKFHDRMRGKIQLHNFSFDGNLVNGLIVSASSIEEKEKTNHSE